MAHGHGHGHPQPHTQGHGQGTGQTQAQPSSGSVWSQNAYGVWKGHPIERRPDVNDHYQIHAVSDRGTFRIAVNILSQTDEHGRKIQDHANPFANALFFYVDEDYHHPITALLPELPLGFTKLPSDHFTEEPKGLALDFIRQNLFDREKMRLLPPVLAGADNDLVEKIDRIVSKALQDERSEVYGFGAQWIDHVPDKIFTINPSVGIHDIHMNQASVGSFAKDNLPWHDGALFFFLPQENRWAAVFLKFQSQAWHSDDTTGAPIGQPGADTPSPLPAGNPQIADATDVDTTTSGTAPTTPTTPTTPAPTGTGTPAPTTEPDGTVRIIAALVNPVGPAPEAESVTLLNTLPDAVNLTGWQIKDRLKNSQTLSGSIPAGATLLVGIAAPVQLSNKGGIISLINAAGLKVDGVSYTAAQAQREGQTIVF